MNTAQRFGATASDTCRPVSLIACAAALPTAEEIDAMLAPDSEDELEASQALQDQLAAEAMHQHRLRERAIRFVVWGATILLLVTVVGAVLEAWQG